LIWFYVVRMNTKNNILEIEIDNSAGDKHPKILYSLAVLFTSNKIF